MMSQEIAAVLRRAAELIAEPEKWCQGDHARDRFLNPCLPSSDKAQCWCMLGAIVRAADTIDSNLYRAADAIAEHLGGYKRTSIGRWNDNPSRTHAEVLAALRAAADAEERNG